MKDGFQKYLEVCCEPEGGAGLAGGSQLATALTARSSIDVIL